MPHDDDPHGDAPRALTPAEHLRHRDYLDLPGMRMGAEAAQRRAASEGRSDLVADDLIGLLDAVERMTGEGAPMMQAVGGDVGAATDSSLPQFERLPLGWLWGQKLGAWGPASIVRDPAITDPEPLPERLHWRLLP